VRVLAAAVARVTAAATGVFLNDVAPRLRASEVPPAEAVELVEAMSSALLVHTPEAFDLLFREHTLLGARRGRLEHEADQARVAIGFVDLAGSTAWAERVTHAEHAAALSRFEDAAWSAASSRGARVVKMIGDEAMLVGSDAPIVVHAAADLCAMADADPALPPARGAVASGHAFARSGDYFGPLVNLAARAVKVAERGQLCVTLPVAASLDRSDFELGEPQEYRLRGIDEPVELVSVKRARAGGRH
jgi:class 3 adenylate cyclase